MPSPSARWAPHMVIALLPAAAFALSSPNIDVAAADTVREARLHVSEKRVRTGDSVRLTGIFPGAGHRAVEISTRRKGSKRWRLIARTRTAKEGRFAERVRPRATGVWRAELAHPGRVTARPDEDGEPAPTEPGGPARRARIDPQALPQRVAVRSRSRVRVSKRNPLVGESVVIRGRVVPGGQRRRLVLHAGGERLNVRTRRGGWFSRRWRPDSTGDHRIRVRARANAMALGSGDGGGKVQAFRRAAASWYGPGFYGTGPRAAARSATRPSASPTRRCPAALA
jgi:hypothetical protein